MLVSYSSHSLLGVNGHEPDMRPRLPVREMYTIKCAKSGPMYTIKCAKSGPMYTIKCANS